MKIDNLRSEHKGDTRRMSARMVWEDCERPAADLFFETNESSHSGLHLNANAFLVASIIPALYFGEKRLFIEGSICPELENGLYIAMRWLNHWYSPNRTVPKIESSAKNETQNRRDSKRAGFFFSGGIDSYATLRMNQKNFPENHPWRIRDGLVVFGLELDNQDSFNCVTEMLTTVADKIPINLIPVYTNIYLLFRDEDANNHFRFWEYHYMGAALSAVAHSFDPLFSVFSISASRDIENQSPLGSHPLVDPCYSSTDLRIRHDGITLSRYEKTKLISEWDVALQNIRVCNYYKKYTSGHLNCGKCEKCVRTMLALLALGALDKTKSFAEKNLSKELVYSKITIKETTLSMYKELLSPLAEAGRHDLASVIKKKIEEYLHPPFINRFKSSAKHIDDRLFSGKLRSFKQKAMPSGKDNFVNKFSKLK